MSNIFKGINFFEIFPGLRKKSKLMILDFKQINNNLPDYQNIEKFFIKSQKKRLNPRLAQYRQKFNDIFLRKSGASYLIGRFGEDRIEMLRHGDLAKEKFTIHLGIDIFCKNLELVYCPYDGEIVRMGNSPGPEGYGHYVFIKHQIKKQTWYSFYGHLGKAKVKLGPIMKGQVIGKLGDWPENGGWSRHLHFEVLKKLPQGGPPDGYCQLSKFYIFKKNFLDPNLVLQLKLPNLKINN
jgi:murein DD-endopeptidase MepM/ murein hydrolase activator NlpD